MLPSSLPEFLRLRCRIPGPVQASEKPWSGHYILYVPVCALRAEDNPSLSAAILLANSLKLPLLVCMPVLDTTLHFTARRLAFLMQAARDMSGGIEAQGARFLCRVTSQGDRSPIHMTLASRAAHVVTDEPFVQPHLGIVRSLIQACREKLWIVDSSCSVPAAIAGGGKPVSKAWMFAKLTQAQLTEALAMFREHAKQSFVVDANQPLEETLIQSGLDRLIQPEAGRGLFTTEALGQIDAEAFAMNHATADQCVLPVTRLCEGGARAAKKRWANWIQSGLGGYAKNRSNPLLHYSESGPSRMSAYLNLGMISSLRMLLDVTTGRGADKFLNEFVTWREISYNHCYHNPNTYGTLDGIPSWAQDSLKKHQSDPRARIVDLKDLENAHSGDPNWDVLQRCLSATGELHNNARMPWGKSVVQWCSTPEAAIAALCHLNDRFALDGMAPPSYGGIGWCFGLFDNPSKFGEVQIYGVVQPKSVSAYGKKKRLDLYEESAKIAQVRCEKKKDCFAQLMHGAKMLAGVQGKRLASGNLLETNKRSKTSP